MNIYPAIDLFDGKVVRLKKGDYNEMTVYSDHPGEFAKKWKSEGAEWIHVVDLQGAKDGFLSNETALKEIIAESGCNVQFGGGVRSTQNIQSVLDLGVKRVIIGTKALDSSFLKQAVKDFGPCIAVGLDIRNGMVQTQGWLESSSASLEDAIAFCNDLGVSTIIYTDIEKDGMLEGPNMEKLEDVLQLSQSRVILSGGVSSLDDLQKCRSLENDNFEGAIVGKALYENKFSLSESLG